MLHGFPWFLVPLFGLYLVAESGSRWLALGFAAAGLVALWLTWPKGES